MFGPLSSLTDMRFPFKLSWSHRLLVDVGTIAYCRKTLTSREERFSRNFRFLAAFVTDGDTADPALATSNVEICYNQVVGCSFLGIALFVGLQQIAHDNIVVSSGTDPKGVPYGGIVAAWLSKDRPRINRCLG